MQRNRAVISFEKNVLNSLVQDEDACVELQNQNYHLALHPFHLNNITGSVQDILNQGISKYDKKLGGILLGYQDIKLLSSAGAVSNDSFFIHIDVAAAFFLFKPEVGKILSGTVNKKSKDHVGCLVHKTFNVSLPKPEDDDDWLGTNVEIGQDIRFRITFTHLEARLPYIRAEFVSILSEQDSGISTSEENTDVKPKKIRFDSNSENEDAVNILVKKHKKKKRKHEEVDQVDNLATDAQEESPKVKKKKHKHKKKFHEEAKDEVDDVENNEEIVKKSSRKHKKNSYEDEEFEQNSFDKKKKSKHKHTAETLEFDFSVKKSETSNFKTVEVHNEDDIKSNVTIRKKRKRHNDVKIEATELEFVDIEHSKEFNEIESSPTKKKHKHKQHLPEKVEDTDVHSKEFNEIESSPTKKKHKHKQHLPEKVEDTDVQISINETFQKVKKSKKSKHKDSLQDLEDALLESTLLSFTETDTTSKTDKKHKSKSKKRQSDHDISLPELNLSSLFNENISTELKAGSFMMADNEDKGIKRFNSASHTTLYDDKMPELPPDSDLENILASVSKKHKKRSHEEKVIESRKRKRSTSSDDFEAPNLKRKHR